VHLHRDDRQFEYAGRLWEISHDDVGAAFHVR